MHRSSESVAAIATALAKAQTELYNPEKAMVGTVYNNRSDSPQTFRYASLSCGLDIVRKTLGGHSRLPTLHKMSASGHRGPAQARFESAAQPRRQSLKSYLPRILLRSRLKSSGRSKPCQGMSYSPAQ
jgi:hypothetical protein